MNEPEAMQSKISARDRAQRLLNHLTAGVAVMAVAGVGGFGYLSATTIPGSTSSSTSTASTSTSTTTATSSSSSSSLSSSSGTVRASSGSGVAVSGGS